MVKRIGILGGISHESTIEYYKCILNKYRKKFKNYHYPEIVIFSLNFQKFTDFEDNTDTRGYANYIMEGIGCLENAGADFILMAANSPHAVFEEVRKKAKVPLINIAEVTANKAKEQGLKKLLLLGIKFTMQSTFYQNLCEQKGIEVITPSESEQDESNRIIFGELCVGNFKVDSKRRLLGIIDNYDVEGVILGCTELPLFLKQEDSDKTLLNTLELHAEAALEYALKK
jgi:aspartate racemase